MFGKAVDRRLDLSIIVSLQKLTSEICRTIGPGEKNQMPVVNLGVIQWTA